MAESRRRVHQSTKSIVQGLFSTNRIADPRRRVHQSTKSIEKGNRDVDDKTTKNVASKQKKKYDEHSRPPIRSKLLYMANTSDNLTKTDVEEFFKDAGQIDWVEIWEDDNVLQGFAHVRFKTLEAAERALQRNGDTLVDRPVRLVAVADEEESSIIDNVTPSHKLKYLFMGNLSRDIQKSHIIDFFSDVCQVVLVRLISDGDPLFGHGYHAHVLFPSSTLAHQALGHDGLYLLDRPVMLALATQDTIWKIYIPGRVKWPGVLRGSWSFLPRDNSDEDEECENVGSEPPPEEKKKYGEMQPRRSRLVYMGNTSANLTKSDVETFFKDAGKTEMVEIWKYKNVSLGFAHVRFETYDAAERALQLNGKELLGLTVELLTSEDVV